MTEPKSLAFIPPTSKDSAAEQPSLSRSRRKFLGNVSGVAVAAVTAGAIGLEPLLGGKESVADASVVPYSSEGREEQSFIYRERTANAEKINAGQQPENGDARRFTDFSASYRKTSL